MEPSVGTKLQQVTQRSDWTPGLQARWPRAIITCLDPTHGSRAAVGPFSLCFAFKPENPKAGVGSDLDLGSWCPEGTPDM